MTSQGAAAGHDEGVYHISSGYTKLTPMARVFSKFLGGRYRVIFKKTPLKRIGHQAYDFWPTENCEKCGIIILTPSDTIGPSLLAARALISEWQLLLQKIK